MRIVIAGLGKSGTTALFFKIKNSLPKDTECLFEPKRYNGSIRTDKAVLTKILLYYPQKFDYESFELFDKKILIVRDPRDRIISAILYEVWNSFYGDDAKVSKFINLLKRKESKPHTVSVLDILRMVVKFKRHNFWKSPKISKIRKKSKNVNLWISNLYGKHFNLSMDFHNHYQDFFIIKYKDFITDKIERLEDYLGLKLYGDANVHQDFQRVVRKKSYGYWKNWFLEKDIGFFRPRFLRFMEKYGCSDNWEINERPVILPEYGSGYVERLVRERRRSEL